ncbi:nudix hydrolase 21, chloroplastic-like isoform X2 [Bidens hawaiensis]|uniref:nudix hydrolase 21, chloroplastic-like isoform X2 n=1 Tax=Bidens hawaiensis TaxID=980011 RepID=UPI00404A66AE
MVAVVAVARTGRQLQVYNGQHRVVVGSVSVLESNNTLEVLVISAQRKGKGMLFPKGGLELDEKIQEAAQRETFEEAGVSGAIGDKLGKWCFKSKGNDAYYEGHMFPLLVKDVSEEWPEKDIRQRHWMSAAKAKESCQYSWMREALDLLVTRARVTDLTV